MVDPEIAVELSGVDKWFSILQVLHGVNLTVRCGEKVVVCGPSGSGKSTMIRCINYLEKHQKGRIIVNGTELTDNKKVIDRVRQDVGMVFQNFNLYPHLTVLENCTLAPRWVKGVARKDAEAVARAYLERVRIPDKADFYPSQLSGGQQRSPDRSA
jgi:general L-amino acid transport system ATP-binding protein